MNFDLPNLIGGAIFGIIGFAAFIYGKKQSALPPILIGIVLMVFPYVISNTIALYGLGVVLTIMLFVLKD